MERERKKERAIYLRCFLTRERKNRPYFEFVYLRINSSRVAHYVPHGVTETTSPQTFHMQDGARSDYEFSGVALRDLAVRVAKQNRRRGIVREVLLLIEAGASRFFAVKLAAHAATTL